MTALRFHDLTLGYDRHPAVHHLDGVVEQGSLTAVVGPNGAGKSTLFKAIVGALKPLAGSIERSGFAASRHRLSAPSGGDRPLVPDQRLRHGGDGVWRRKGPFGGIDRKDHAAIEAGLAAVGLTGFEQRGIGTLSGGQMQRMLFARLLIQDSRVIVLDEPFSAVDGKTVADLMHLVRRWHWERRTVLGRHPRYRIGASVLSANSAARPRAGGLGCNARGADAPRISIERAACARRSTRPPRPASARRRESSASPCSTTS